MDRSDRVPGVGYCGNVSYILLKNGTEVPLELFRVLLGLWDKLDKGQFKYVCEKYCNRLEGSQLNSKNEPEQKILDVIERHKSFLPFCVQYYCCDGNLFSVKRKKTRYWFLVRPSYSGGYSMIPDGKVMGRVPKKD
jgi:hypothetical protein